MVEALECRYRRLIQEIGWWIENAGGSHVIKLVKVLVVGSKEMVVESECRQRSLKPKFCWRVKNAGGRGADRWRGQVVK